MNRPVIALLASCPLKPNIKAVLYNLGQLFGDDVVLHLIMGNEKPPSRLEETYTIFRFDPPLIDRSGIGFAFKATRKYLAQHCPDVLMNASQPFPLGVAVVTVGNYHGIPTILRITGDHYGEAAIAPTHKRYKKKVANCILDKVYKKADIILPVGNNISRKLQNNGYDADKIYSLPQPFNTEDVLNGRSFERHDDRLVTSLRKDTEIITYVGRLTWKKGADRLLEIIDRVSEQSTKYQFCIVGDGPYKKDFKTINDRIAVSVGAVPRNKVFKYLRTSDVFVYPSRNDGLPNVILEALASRLPILASPVGEIPRYITHTISSNKEFALKILSDIREVPDIPDWFDEGVQKRSYIKVFNYAMEK